MGINSGIFDQLERLEKASLFGDFSIKLDDSALSGNEAEIIKILNSIIGNYHKAVEYELMKYKLTRDALGIGLWDMDVVKEDPLNPANEFIWSQELREMLGFSDENDLPNILSAWIDKIHPEDKKRVVDLFYDHLIDRTNKIKLDGEYRLMLKNGNYRHFHAFGTTLRDKDGAALRVAGAIEDIEEKKQMQNLLYEANMLNKAMLASAPIGIIMFNENLEVVDCNETICRMFESDKEYLKKHFFDLMPEHQANGEKSVPLAKRYMLNALNGNDLTIEWSHEKRSGGVIPCEVTLTRIIVGGKYIGLAHTYDISNIRKLTEDLKEALAQATAASRAKGDFLSNMSHEMRTPLNAIIGMTVIGKNAETIEKKNYALNKISEASSHLLGVINDVLDMAKIEANKLELSHVEFDFDKMLQNVITVINFRVEEKEQEFTVNIDRRIPRFLVGDDKRLSQVITNLLSNAVKFTPDRGKIHLEAAFLGETDGLCELRIEVADNGIGISKEQQERLFHAFEQADSGTSREYGGTGLGLVISKRIVKLMNGSISVESESGKGARFMFTVKVQRGGTQSKKPWDDVNSGREKNIISGEFAGKRMLLAEDIEINREIIISLLQNTGIIIDCAENGKQALEMIEAAPGKYDIVFMDVQMPQMDGLEATRRIRKFEKGIPIIAMTANVFKNDIEECHNAGMNDHIGKPLDIEIVLTTLRKYLTCSSTSQDKLRQEPAPLQTTEAM